MHYVSGLPTAFETSFIDRRDFRVCYLLNGIVVGDATVLWGESSEMIYSSVSACRMGGAVAPTSAHLANVI